MPHLSDLAVLDFQMSVAETLEVAAHAERCGYGRYWLTEHNGPSAYHASSLIVSAMVAGTTERIRVGPAGILLRFYSPLRAAQDFRLLAHLFEDRIDAGFCGGRAPAEIARALLQGHEERDYTQKVEELVRYTRRDQISDAPDGQVVAAPAGIPGPPLWYLGSSDDGASLAASLGVSFGFAFHFSFSRDEPDVLKRYRDEFRAAGAQVQPDAVVSVAVACDADEKAAHQLAAAWSNPSVAARVVGTPAQCREQLLELERRYECARIAVLPVAEDLATRLRALSLLAESMAG